MTIDDIWLVCFSMAVPACISICLAVMFELSVAKSVSMMRPVAALLLVLTLARLLYTCYRRLAAAPRPERTLPTAASAVSSLAIEPLAAAPLAISAPVPAVV
jgi:hypothetical protein